MSLRTARTAGLLRAAPFLLVFGFAACVVPLSERYAPLESGGVSGPAADCRTVSPPGEGAPSAETKTKWVGRFELGNPSRPRFDWSGNAMNARFRGTEVTWGAEADVEIVFEQVVDGVAEQVVLGGAAPDKATVKVPDGEHEITIVRSSEALFKESAFVPFAFGQGTVQLPPIERPRRIEFIGDSITCGYGNEGPNATCPFAVPIRRELDEGGRPIVDPDGQPRYIRIPETQNIYLAYGSIAARRLSADAVTLCHSGKGVVRNQVDEVGDVARTTMAEYYRRTLATSGTSEWDFAKDVPEPQVVFISLGTNDFAHVEPDGVSTGIDLQAFQSGYRKFVDFVRSKRPTAHIFLALSPMVSETFPLERARSSFRDSLRSIVAQVNGAGDDKVYFIELVEMGTRYGLGCDYHPNLEVHRIMADQVASAIASKTCWTTVDAR